jgi:transcriptional regulator with XRE-family HTH domain
MDIYHRLKELREHLGLTTRVFGDAINMTSGSITNMEKGRREVTDRTVKDICRAFGVNQNWLKNGDGSMFEDVLADLDLSSEVKELADQYSHLTNSDKVLVKELVSSLAEKSHGLKK